RVTAGVGLVDEFLAALGTQIEGPDLSPAALFSVGRLLVDPARVLPPGSLLAAKFRVHSLLAEGRASVTLLVKHELLGRPFVAKILRPGTEGDLRDQIRRVAGLAQSPSLVVPTDLFTTVINDATGQPCELLCVVSPFVRGERLDRYLESA